MMRILLKRIPLLLFVGAILSCEKPNQPQPKPDDKPSISIPTQSQAVFNKGISFSTPSPQQANQPQTQTVTFTATESWSATVTDTKASTWLTIEPSSGGAGTVNMTVKAQPNDTDQARRASVTIKCGSMNKTFTVEQAAKPAATVAVMEVTLNKTELTLKVGDTETLVATVKPDDATDKTVTWSTSDASIATVDESGKVTAVKEGSATITAKAGEKSATCSVTVSKKVVAVSEITLNKSSLKLNEGDAETLVATVKPDDATDKTVTWSTSDASIATVDESGKVTAVKEGSATIAAKAGDKSATCKVTVSKNVIAVTEITLNKTTLSLKEGDSETLVATVKPDDATDKTVTWSTSDASIATMDESGKVTAVKEGSATITAKAGEKSATCSVTVSKNVIEVTEITLNKTTLSLKEGDSETLVATVKPDDATDKTVTWSTSDASIATVDESGKVTAVKEGTATITAKAGEKTATCSVTVISRVVKVEEISLNKTELTLLEGNSEALVATVKPENAAYRAITWSSAEPRIATVDPTGKVIANSVGSTVITAATGEKNEITATCIVTVIDRSISVSPASLSFNPSGGTKQIHITSNGDWSITGAPDWCTFSSISGTGNAVVQLTAAANNGPQRTAKIAISCGRKEANLNVLQTAGGWENQRFVHRSLYMMFTSVYCPYSETMNKKIAETDSILRDKYCRVDVHVSGLGDSPLNFPDAPKLESIYWFATPGGIIDYRTRLSNISGEGAYLVPQTLISSVTNQESLYPVATGTAFSSSLSGRTLSVRGKLYSHEAELFKLTVYVLEDNVVFGEKIYNNVLRLSLTDVLGDEIRIETKNTTKDFQYNVTIPDGYKTENLSLLVIVQRQYGAQTPIRDLYYGDYYVDNCRRVKVGKEAKLEVYENVSGGGNEGIYPGDEITF